MENCFSFFHLFTSSAFVIFRKLYYFLEFISTVSLHRVKLFYLFFDRATVIFTSFHLPPIIRIFFEEKLHLRCILSWSWLGRYIALAFSSFFFKLSQIVTLKVKNGNSIFVIENYRFYYSNNVRRKPS